MGLYLFILTIVLIAAYSIYEIYSHTTRKATMKMLSKPGEDNKNLNQIIELVYDYAIRGKDAVTTRNHVSKVLLMEDLNLRPRELKHYLGILTVKNIIKEYLDYVTITPFGIQFYQVFKNDQLNINPPK